MSDPFLGEMQAFPINIALGGFRAGSGVWMPCLGQLLPIQSNTALFSLIGTYYGGNGTTNFALPNLNGAITNSQGTGPGLQPRAIGETLGTTTVTLSAQEMASHTHGLQLGAANATGAQSGPGTQSNMMAIDPSMNGFVAPPGNTTFAPNAVTFTGQGQAHDNMQPTLAIVWCIATAGVYPSFGES
jgi:microcystin-dependent protein